MKPIKIALTTGDPDGIGTEVAAKAIASIKFQRPVHLYFFRSPQCPKSHLIQIDKNIYRKPVSSIDEALNDSHLEDSILFDISLNSNPIFWVKQAAELCLNQRLDALVTGPLSKPLIMQSDLDVVGHTGLFRRLLPDERMFMGFLGKLFNVVLLTDHIGLRQVPDAINPNSLLECIIETHKLSHRLGLTQRPIGLLGLNPHAGDRGIIGSEEQNYFQAVIKECNAKGIAVEGPLVPDVAFQKSNWNKYSFYIATYHDQGLIPFKMAHGQESGVHLTMGLPFIRTSVDHGTAHDIFNQNRAISHSMQEALETALILAQ